MDRITRPIQPFGKLKANRQSLPLSRDRSDAYEMALKAFLPVLDHQVSTSPNVLSREARVKGLVEGFIKPLGPVLMSGKTLEGGLRDLDRLCEDVEAAIEAVKHSYLSHAKIPANAPQVFNPNTIKGH